MGIDIPYKKGELVFIVVREAKAHKELVSLGYDHLGHRGYEEHTVTDGYEWVVKEVYFYYGLLDDVPSERIFRDKRSARFKQMELQAI